MADFDKSTFDPKAAAEARKKEMDQMAEKLEAGVKDVFQGENYKAYLDFCGKMPRYSVNNQILIMMQAYLIRLKSNMSHYMIVFITCRGQLKQI